MQHKFIRTPVDTLNVLGAGGLKMGSIAQVYGKPGSGKSTFCYQSASLFLKDYPDGVVHVIDVENSADEIRFENVFKLDSDRVQVHHYSSLEEAFKLIMDCTDQYTYQTIGKIKEGRKEIKILSKDRLLKMEDKEFFKYCEQFSVGTIHDKKPIVAKAYGDDRERVMKALALAGGYRLKDGGLPVLIIWDTIAVSRPQAELDKISEGNMAKNAAGMNVSTQVISTKLSACLSSMGGKDVTLFLPNQVRLKDFGSFLGPKESFYGSFALEHSCHYILKFQKVDNADSRNKNYDDDIKMKTGTDFIMKIEKTKFCPATQGVKLYINDQLGGIIIPRDELIHLAVDLGILRKERGPVWVFSDDDDQVKYKWDREDDEEFYISNNPKVRRKLIEKVTKHYRCSYHTLNNLYEKCGIQLGKPSEEELHNKKTLDDLQTLQEMDDNPFS